MNDSTSTTAIPFSGNSAAICWRPARDRTQAAKDLLAAGWTIDEVIRLLDGAPIQPTIPYYPPLQPYTIPSPMDPPPYVIWCGGSTWTATTDTKVTLNS